MSENNSWKDKLIKRELSEQELQEISGGASNVLYFYQCETCGWPWNTLASSNDPVPVCCGKRMTYVGYHII